MKLAILKPQGLKSGARSVVFVYLLLIASIILVAIFFPLFVSARNTANVVVQIAPLAIVSIGQAIVIIGGGVDLSVGAVISLTTVIAAYAMPPSPLGIAAGLALIVLAAAAVGLINGFICNETNIPPLIVTLCTTNIVQGFILWYKAEPGGKVPKALSEAILGGLSVFSTPAVIMVVLYAAFMFVMRGTRFGVHTYAIGNNEGYARMAGVNVKLTRMGGYLLSSLLAAVAGIIIACRISSGSSQVGNSFQLDSLTAVLVGGTPFSGGQGFIIGALAGSSIVSIIRNALNIAGVSPFYQYIAKGALLIVAMIANSLTKKKE